MLLHEAPWIPPRRREVVHPERHPAQQGWADDAMGYGSMPYPRKYWD